MKDRYDILVVGAGAAGLTAAAYTARAGLDTLVCERANKTGGLVGSFSREGFQFDAGIRAFEDSGVIAPMLRSLGISIDFVQNPVSIGIKDRMVRLGGEQSLHEYAGLFRSFFPERASEIDAIMDEIRKVMRYMDVLYGIENPLFLESELRDPTYLTKKLLPWLVKYSANIKKADRLSEPVRQYLKKFTDCEPLIDMICQHFFADTPTFFALSYFGLYLDYRYPVGGTAILPDKLTDYVVSHGGEVLTGAQVVRLIPEHRSAVLADGREVRYRQLIWAADQTALYRALDEPLPPRVKRQKDLVERSHGIDSVLTVYTGTDFKPAEIAASCGAHAFYTPELSGLGSLPDWRTLQSEGTAAVYRWLISYLEKTTYEISVPVLRDASLAPEGKTGFVVSTLFDYELAKFFEEAGEYEAFKSKAQETILRVLGNTILPKLPERVRFTLCSTPLTIERETGARHGAITGWAHTNRDLPAEHHFSKIKNSVLTGLPDLLQCGMWTFSPAGLPVSLMTGKLAADEAIRRLKRRPGNE
jgi:phytoene dehydrogenase-like protein